MKRQQKPQKKPYLGIETKRYDIHGNLKRHPRDIGELLTPEEAEKQLRAYLEVLIFKLWRMEKDPYRLPLSQRPDDRFLNEIDLSVLYELPAYKEFQGKKFPPQLVDSDVLFPDGEGSGFAVLDIKRLRSRVMIRIEKGGQRKRIRKLPVGGAHNSMVSANTAVDMVDTMIISDDDDIAAVVSDTEEAPTEAAHHSAADNNNDTVVI